MLGRGVLGLIGVLVLAGCGGKSASTTGDADTGDTREPLCRKFAARYATDGRESTCSFDRGTLSLHCSPTRYGVVTTTWDTIDDAVDDNRPVGRITASGRSFVSTDVTFTDAIAYDDAGRPLFSEAGVIETPPVENEGYGRESFEYAAWDPEKRPTSARVTLVFEGPGVPPGGCGSLDETYEYDDANQRFFTTRAPGGSPLCHALVTTRIFDADGLLLEETWESQPYDGSLTRRTYTTLETGEICRD
jgi:hypothetical protein